MAPTSFIKLANKLPRIALPTAMPNGQAAQWSLDPYFETSVNGSPWVQGNSAFVNAAFAKANGITIKCGQQYQGLIQQIIPTQTGIPKIYVEINELKGVVWIYDGQTVIQEPGAYIIEEPAAIISQLWYYTAESLFTPDPYFRSVPIGMLPVKGSASVPSWCALAVSNNIRKGTDGRMYLNNNAAVGNTILTHKNGIPDNTKVEITVVVDYIPPGGGLEIGTYGSGTLKVITAPGTYQVLGTWVDANPVFVGCNVQAQGEAIISYFQFKAQSQSWVIDGDQFSRPSALWMAEKSIFDQIIDPKYQVSSNQYSRDNLASSIQSNIPQLGYCEYIPPAGMYRVGDTIYNPSGSPSGWRCVQAGNPGVWAPLPML